MRCVGRYPDRRIGFEIITHIGETMFIS